MHGKISKFSLSSWKNVQYQLLNQTRVLIQNTDDKLKEYAKNITKLFDTDRRNVVEENKDGSTILQSEFKVCYMRAEDKQKPRTSEVPPKTLEHR